MKRELSNELREKIKAVRLLVMDVDGVMTDGRIIMDDEGREVKHFNVRDGHGIKMLMRHGVEVVVLTGRKSSVVEHRARDLGIKEVYQAAFNKLEVCDDILRSKGVHYHQVAFIGDDIVDVPLLKRVGFSVAVADAIEYVKEVVDYVTVMRGGHGAVREVCELILMEQGKWDEIAKKYDLNNIA